MAIAKFRQGVRKANNISKQVAKQVNKADQLSNGLILRNPYAGSIVPVLNYGNKALDYFDTLFGTDPVTHPQITSGSVAGVSQSMVVRRAAPKFTGSRGNITITHKELVSEVAMLASGALGTSPTYPTGQSAYTLSPLNATLFPWLSQIAANYDYFKFNRVRLVYVPLCSTATSGRVMLGFDPDGTDAIPYDRSGLSSYKCSVDASAWGVTKLDCALPTNQPWYQTNEVTYDASYSTSSQGQCFWSTWGGAAGTVGELYVLYEVVLKDPQPPRQTAFRANGVAGAVTNQFTAYAPAAWVADAATTIKLLFQATGTYRINFFGASTAGAATLALTYGGNISMPFSGKIGDGTNFSVYAIVNVTSAGIYTAPGAATGSYAYAQLASITALGAWQVTIEKIALPTIYP